MFGLGWRTYLGKKDTPINCELREEPGFEFIPSGQFSNYIHDIRHCNGFTNLTFQMSSSLLHSLKNVIESDVRVEKIAVTNIIIANSATFFLASMQWFHRIWARWIWAQHSNDSKVYFIPFNSVAFFATMWKPISRELV